MTTKKEQKKNKRKTNSQSQWARLITILIVIIAIIASVYQLYISIQNAKLDELEGLLSDNVVEAELEEFGFISNTHQQDFFVASTVSGLSIVKNGKIDESEYRKSRFTLTDSLTVSDKEWGAYLNAVLSLDGISATFLECDFFPSGDIVFVNTLFKLDLSQVGTILGDETKTLVLYLKNSMMIEYKNKSMALIENNVQINNSQTEDTNAIVSLIKEISNINITNLVYLELEEKFNEFRIKTQSDVFFEANSVTFSV